MTLHKMGNELMFDCFYINFWGVHFLKLMYLLLHLCKCNGVNRKYWFSSGAFGVTGATGATGQLGPEGPAGETGSVGPHGATGSKGHTGGTGATGNPGNVGPKGYRGPPGEGCLLSSNADHSMMLAQLPALLSAISGSEIDSSGKNDCRVCHGCIAA